MDLAFHLRGLQLRGSGLVGSLPVHDVFKPKGLFSKTAHEQGVRNRMPDSRNETVAGRESRTSYDAATVSPPTFRPHDLQLQGWTARMREFPTSGWRGVPSPKSAPASGSIRSTSFAPALARSSQPLPLRG